MLWAKKIDDLDAEIARLRIREAVLNEQLCRTEDQVEKLLDQNRYLQERLKGQKVHTFEVG